MYIMKKTILILSAASLLGFAACNSKNVPVNLESQSDTISWVIGESMARSIISTGMQYDKEMVLRAVEATLNNQKQPIDQATYLDVMDYLNKQISLQQHDQMVAQKDVQNEYFVKLAQEHPDFKKTDHGIYYEVLTPGKGRNCKIGDIATFDYRAYTAPDNQLFDQTYGNVPTIVHVVGSPMAPGLQEAFCQMNAGSTYRFYVPYELVAGVWDIETVQPYTPVIYEIELKDIK